MTDVFGYSPPDRSFEDVTGIEVAEGKHADTLEPMICTWFRFADGDRFAFALPLDLTLRLAEEFINTVERARERHWEQL